MVSSSRVLVRQFSDDRPCRTKLDIPHKKLRYYLHNWTWLALSAALGQHKRVGHFLLGSSHDGKVRRVLRLIDARSWEARDGKVRRVLSSERSKNFGRRYKAYCTSRSVKWFLAKGQTLELSSSTTNHLFSKIKLKKPLYWPVSPLLVRRRVPATEFMKSARCCSCRYECRE